MAIAIGDVWAFALEQRLFGQQIFNTFALKVTGTSGTVTETNFMDNAWKNVDAFFNQDFGLRKRILALQSPQVTHVAWHVKRVQGLATNTFVFPIAHVPDSSLPGDAETANIAMSIDRKGLEAGKRSRGRIAVAGIPTGSMDQGKFLPGAIVVGNNVGLEMVGEGSTSDLTTFVMGFWSPEKQYVNKAGIPVTLLATFIETVTSAAKATVRVQRSRTVGVGT